MFDRIQTSSESVEFAFDMKAMVARLRDLDDAELALIEDDLDFYHFSGFVSDRLKALFEDTAALKSAA